MGTGISDLCRRLIAEGVEPRAIDDGLPPGQVAKAKLKDFVEGESPRREFATDQHGEEDRVSPSALIAYASAPSGSRIESPRRTTAPAVNAGLLTPRGHLKLVAVSDGRSAPHAATKRPPASVLRLSLRVIDGGKH